MDFSLTAEQKELRKAVINFANKELNDNRTKETVDSFPWSKWKKCSEMNLMSMPFPEDYGGCSFDLLTTVLLIEALASASKDSGLVHAIVTQLVCGIQIMLFGSDSQKEELLPDICTGRKVAAQALTEADAGSDVASIRTTALRQHNGYVINGTKMFISNGPISDIAIVFAVTDTQKRGLSGFSFFIVEKKIIGFDRGKPLEKMGLSTLQNSELVFDNCFVQESSLLGREGQGMIIFNESVEWERILFCAVHTGVLGRILATSLQYANDRRQFGNAIAKFQSISNKIADMKVKLELSRLILYKAAWQKDNKMMGRLEPSIAKLFASESLRNACLEAVQIHGAYGYMKEFGIEKDLRDSIASSIYAGTSEIQRNIICAYIGL